MYMGLLFALFVVFMLILQVNQQMALQSARTQFPPPGDMIEVNGYRIHLYCTGNGSPTVVIDAGNGSLAIEWIPIQEELSRSLRVCVFDRAGYGWSEAGVTRRDGMQVVSELHEVLNTAGEVGPFLLVGHSLGGVHVRLYAAYYPNEVAGLVLVDTAYPLEITPEFETQMRTSIGFYQAMGLLTGSGLMRIIGPLGSEDALPATARKLPQELRESYLNLLLDPQQYRTAIAEMTALPDTFLQTNQALIARPVLAKLPLIVLTAGKIAGPGSTPHKVQLVETPISRIEMDAELAAASSFSQQRVLEDSGHSVHQDAPEAIVQAVIDLVKMIENK